MRAFDLSFYMKGVNNVLYPLEKKQKNKHKTPKVAANKKLSADTDTNYSSYVPNYIANNLVDFSGGLLGI